MLSNFSVRKMLNSVRNLFKFEKEAKESINSLKEQVEDHLNAINENTNELQSNYEFSLEVESKTNKLAERIDEISMLLGLNMSQKQHEIPKLTAVEKEIFLALYRICDEKEYTTYKELSKLLNLSETLVMSYTTILVEKGIPILKNYSDGQTKLKLSSYFKNIQTKSDILKINDDISKQIVLNKFLSKNR